MNWLRCKVSGKRNRYKDEHYNLDITYITERILAMSFPASGFEKWYRNHINKVASFLDNKHGGKYRIFNLANRDYNTDRFHHRVSSYKWEDHHPPTVYLLFKICYDIYEFLLEPDTVAVIHWNAGKGRTGTCIASFLLYSGLSKTAEDAIRYYGRKRFSTGLGITQPSQLRFVRYFELVLKGVVRSPCIKILKGVRLHTVPRMASNSCKPYLEIITLKNFKKIFTAKYSDHLTRYKATKLIAGEKVPSIEISPAMNEDFAFSVKKYDLSNWNF